MTHSRGPAVLRPCFTRSILGQHGRNVFLPVLGESRGSPCTHYISDCDSLLALLIPIKLVYSWYIEEPLDLTCFRVIDMQTRANSFTRLALRVRKVVIAALREAVYLGSFRFYCRVILLTIVLINGRSFPLLWHSKFIATHLGNGV